VVVPAPQIQAQVAEIPKVTPRSVEPIVDTLVPQVEEEIVKEIETIPQERIEQRTMEQTVDVPVPQVVEETVVATPQERIQLSMPTDEPPQKRARKTSPCTRGSPTWRTEPLVEKAKNSIADTLRMLDLARAIPKFVDELANATSLADIDLLLVGIKKRVQIKRSLYVTASVWDTELEESRQQFLTHVQEFRSVVAVAMR
jgi:hypothetical protein